MRDKSLIDRMTEDLTTCLVRGTYRKFGKDKEDNRRCYCTYFFTNGQFQPVDCGMRCDEVYYIKIGCGMGEMYVPYYRCRDLTVKGKKK